LIARFRAPQPVSRCVDRIELSRRNEAIATFPERDMVLFSLWPLSKVQAHLCPSFRPYLHSSFESAATGNAKMVYFAPGVNLVPETTVIGDSFHDAKLVVKAYTFRRRRNISDWVNEFTMTLIQIATV